MLLLNRCAVRRIGNNRRFPKVLGCLSCVVAQLSLHLREPMTEELKLTLIHVLRVAHLEKFFFSKKFLGHHNGFLSNLVGSNQLISRIQSFALRCRQAGVQKTPG